MKFPIVSCLLAWTSLSPSSAFTPSFQRKHITSSSLFSSTPLTAFDDGERPFQITTPIYYVNDKPHIGHAYTSTACDVIARFMRLSGRDVFFLTGTDEHGQKVEQSAAKKGMECQDFVNEVSQSFRDLLGVMNISNDYFVRTTDEAHKESVKVRNGKSYEMKERYVSSSSLFMVLTFIFTITAPMESTYGKGIHLQRNILGMVFCKR